jgi:hypothetical protein
LSERPHQEPDPPDRAERGLIARLRALRPRDALYGGVALVGLILFLDVVGVLDVSRDEQLEPSSGVRLPGEYLYLDDERVDAYLGQLRGGLSPTEQRSISLTQSREGQLGVEQVVQVGGNVERKEVIERTVSSQAADRFYILETELAARFADPEAFGPQFRRLEAKPPGCAEITRLETIKEGQILRITGAQLLVPTYALALARVAHADQFLGPGQEPLSPVRLSRFAGESQPALKELVDRLGPDPRVPFRLWIRRRQGPCQVFMPVRYSKLIDAPSLLTGPMTVVGKIVRRLTKIEPEYFDVDTAVRYTRALNGAPVGVKRALGLDTAGIRKVVNSSATVTYPGLVVLPLAMYK